MMLLISTIAATMAMAMMLGGHAAASDVVIMRPGDVGEERAFFETLLERARADCYCDFQMKDFWIGRFDVNDDGRYELFVSYQKFPFCGSFGCPNPVFELQNGQWQELTGLDGGAQVYDGLPPGSSPYGYIIVSDERFDSYRTLIGREIGQQWSVDETTGRAGYRAFCLTLACLWDFTGPPEEELPKPAKRKRRSRR